MKQERLIPLPEYARLTGTPETTIRLHLKEGRIRGVRLGRYWYIPMEVEVETETARARVFTFFTHAGGAGKTSLARDLGFELASRGYRVLLVDADPQANLTAWMGMDPGEVEDRETLISVVHDKGFPDPRRAIIQGVALDLVPANMNLAMAEVMVPTKNLGMVLLRTALYESGLLDRYDFVLVDSPPSLGSIAAMSALAGEGLIVPVETSAKGMQALKGVLEVSKDYLRTLLALRLLSPTQAGFIRLLVPTKYDSRTVQDRKMKLLLEEASRVGPLAPPIAYRPAPYKEAIDQGLPVQAVSDEKVHEEMKALAQAFLQSLGLEHKEVSQWA
ncbi:MAG: AAA family ATPase [Meiothermus sp.]|jgi:chromosome partitioning protein|uniref:AAA family ATPase n=1 Tax=Meiothermus TaxID=65551 RepID=UPI0004872E6B|nr:MULTISPECIES: AAA family ATPase [Meiothermus]MDT7921034.1 AAA family ATPase [Meiothermus sp.]